MKSERWREVWSVKSKKQGRAMNRWVCIVFTSTVFLLGILHERLANAEPTGEQPLVVDTEKKEIQLYGVIYPERFNAARGDEAHYHLLVWHQGKSPNALIETPADDLDFYTALVKLGATPGNNLSMTSWTERKDEHRTASHEKVTGSSLDIRIVWKGKYDSIPVSQLFRQSHSLTQNSELGTSNPELKWRFGGNRDRLFNKFPMLSRPGCLVCLYSCPSGKVSNAALSIHDYVTFSSHFAANIAILPPDGTPVIMTFRLATHERHE